jgi:hypothetical protein
MKEQKTVRRIASARFISLKIVVFMHREIRWMRAELGI